MEKKAGSRQRHFVLETSIYGLGDGDHEKQVCSVKCESDTHEYTEDVTTCLTERDPAFVRK